MAQQHSGRAFRWGATLFFVGLSACAAPESDGGGAAETVDVASMVNELGGQCRAECGERLREIAERCRENDIAPRQCHARLAAARERCAEACDLREPRRDPPRACDARCALQAHHDLRACIADDGDARECAQAAREDIQACREDRCAERPERPSCEDSCAARARAVTRQCVENGGDERACRRRGEEFGRQCLAQHCAPPADDGRECAERCGAAGREVHRECLEAGRDERACRERAASFVASCLEERCERPEPPAPPSCEDACAARARAVGAECAEQGGGRERCAARAREALETCLSERCEGGGEQPPPEPPVCEERCGAEGRRIHAECIEAGIAEERCAARAREFVGACVAEHCDGGGEQPPPEAPACEDRCAAEARRINAACVEAGNDAEACAGRARHFLEACTDRCGGEEPPPPEAPACEDRCAAEARRINAACVEAGNDAEACAGRARHFLEACTDRCGGEQPPPPPPEEGPTCAGRCEMAADAGFRRCVEETGDERACRERRAHALRACIAENCER